MIYGKIKYHYLKYKYTLCIRLSEFLQKELSTYAYWSYKICYSYDYFLHQTRWVQHNIHLEKYMPRGALHFFGYRKLWIPPHESDEFFGKWTLWDAVINILYALIDNFDTFFKNIRLFLQRGWRGYSDYDTWDFSTYLPQLISKVSTHYDLMRHTIHYGITDEEWSNMLSDISEGFALLAKVSAGDAQIIPKDADEKDIKIMQREEKEYGIHILSSEEVQQIETAWKLLQKHLIHMCD